MPEKSEISPLDKKTILNQNSNIDAEIVSAHENLERKLRKLGVEIKPTFNIEPPLGRDRTGSYTRCLGNW